MTARATALRDLRRDSTGRRLRACLALGGVALLSLAAAPPASAHGIGGDAATASVVGYVGIGVEHMLLGWDHLLFVAGIVLLSGSARRAAKVISAFVIGHSLTLITATLAGWEANALLVDVVIVLSVAFVGGWGMFGRPKRWDIFTALVFGFGLIHGLGLATRFQALGVPEDGMVWRLIAFNVGIEIGQVTAILVVVVAAGFVSTMVKQGPESTLAKLPFVALFAVGAMVAPLVAYDQFGEVGGDDVSEVALPEGADCSITDRSQSFPAAGGGHTEKAFYEPGEDVPLESFGHSLGDGYVIVLYAEDLPDADVAALRDFVASGDPRGVLAGTGEVTDGKVKAVTMRQEMTCESVHVGALRQFSRAWMDSIGATT
ncbi:MAG TPA: HupE/UreJ family protein [Nocardioides sp.]|uniref:HupE/UreJ family protein n=1 Tax=Nocardioides sp. TaxID=35761 RepID=UPI002EDA329C